MNPVKFSAVRFHVDYIPNVLKEYSSLLSWAKIPNLKILDVGTGPGQTLLEIERILPRNYSEIIATDKAEPMIEYLNSLEKDSRISTRLLDIETKNMPEDLKNRFDFVCSTNAIMYMLNPCQSFVNCSAALKPNGELFFAWCKKTYLFDVYKSMTKIEKWSPFLSDYKNWSHYFDNEDPIGTVKAEMKKVGLTVLKAEEHKDVFFHGADQQVFLDTYDAIDFMSARLPNIDVPKFKEDFFKSALGLSLISVDDDAEDGLKAKHPFPFIFVAARKN